MAEPRILYTIPNIKAYHVQDGEETSLTPWQPQPLSLLMVPTAAGFHSPTTAQGSSSSQSHPDDFYLHLHLPPELDLPLPATTQIYHQPPNAYLIPRWDLGPERGAFTRIEFPGIGPGRDQVTQEDVDTFESILAQCTAFLERAPPPPAYNKPSPYEHDNGGLAAGGYETGGYKPYHPADYAPGQGYAANEKVPQYTPPVEFAGTSASEKTALGAAGTSSLAHHDVLEGSSLGGGHEYGQIVLIDEENGSVVGELSENLTIEAGPGLKLGSKGRK
jgi:spartin